MSASIETNAGPLTTVVFESANHLMYKTDGSGKDTTLVVTTSVKSGATFTLPTSFYRLNLLQPNTYFSRADMTDTDTFAVCSTPNKYCYKESKPIYCDVNNFYDMTANTCGACPANTMVDFGSLTSSADIKQGFCSVPCGTAKLACNTITATPNRYVNYQTTCENTFTAIHTTCYTESATNTGALHYSSYFNSPDITLPVTSLSEYYVEVWFYSDKIFLPYNPTPTTSQKYYILYTSGLRVRRDHDFANNNTYTLIDSTGNQLAGSTTFDLNFGQWYRLAYKVSYVNPTYTVTFFLTHYSANTTGTTNDTNMPLTQIKFCSTCSVNNYWFTGYYKNLRVWKSANISTTWFETFDR